MLLVHAWCSGIFERIGGRVSKLFGCITQSLPCLIRLYLTRFSESWPLPSIEKMFHLPFCCPGRYSSSPICLQIPWTYLVSECGLQQGSGRALKSKQLPLCKILRSLLPSWNYWGVPRAKHKTQKIILLWCIIKALSWLQQGRVLVSALQIVCFLLSGWIEHITLSWFLDCT